MLIFIRNTDSFTIQTAATGEEGRTLPGIRLHDGQLLFLVDNRPKTTPPFDVKPPRTHNFHIPLLKSNLQKAIRRKARGPALRTAWHLLCQDSNELLRRLPVILCEDTQLEPRTFVELVWLMAAVSKGYRLLWSDAAWVMSAVSTSLETTGRWNLDVPGPPLAAGALQQNPVAAALHIRVAFGGMRGDVAFLNRLRDRAAVGTLPLWSGPPVWLEEDIPWLEPEEDILLEAVDQHVYPRLADFIPGLRLDAVWFCRSSLNVRSYVGEGAAEATSQHADRRAALQANLDEHTLALELFSRRMRRRADRPVSEEETEIKTASVAAISTLDCWVTKRS